MTSQSAGEGSRRDLADLTAAMAQHPDIAELRTTVSADDQPKGGPAMIDAHDVHPRWRGRVAVYLALLGLALISVLPWMWSLANQAMTASPSRVIAHFAGIEFQVSADAALVMITIAMGMIGSVIVALLTLASRSGHGKLEDGFMWWYVTRPVTGALLAMLFYLAVVAGFFSTTATTERPQLVVAAAVGGLAGLFTDQVIGKMRNILGLSPVNVSSATAARAAQAGKQAQAQALASHTPPPPPAPDGSPTRSAADGLDVARRPKARGTHNGIQRH